MRWENGWMNERCVNSGSERTHISCISHGQIDRFLKGAFTDRQGNFNYREWVKILRVNGENES